MLQPVKRNNAEDDGYADNEYFDGGDDSGNQADPEKGDVFGTQNVDVGDNDFEDYGYVEKKLPLRRPRKKEETAKPPATEKPSSAAGMAEAEPTDTPEHNDGKAAVAHKGREIVKQNSRQSVEMAMSETPTKKSKADDDDAGVTQENEEEDGHVPAPAGRLTRSGRSSVSSPQNNVVATGNWSSNYL